MPIHDWSLVDAGTFHDFHQAWTIEIRNALNRGLLPKGYFAMAEQIVSGPIPDVITLQRAGKSDETPDSGGGIAVADAPPRARFVCLADADIYAGKANRIAIRHRLGRVVAVIEIISPGNKSSRHALRALVAKADEMFRQGISLLAVDLFPPSPRDPQGIHKEIWDAVTSDAFVLPPDKPLTAVAYCAGNPMTAYVEPLAVGDLLPSLPIFLNDQTYIPAPLEATYEATWAACPAEIKELVSNAPLGDATG